MVYKGQQSHEQEKVKTRGAWRKSLPGAFVDASQGALLTLRTERNMKIHYVAACVMVAWCLVVRPNAIWVMGVLVTISLMMAVEMMNTAIEHVVDLVAGDTHHNEAKWAKDAAAGGVLLTGIGALTVGIILGCRLWPWKFLLFSPHNLGGAALSGIGLLVLLVWGLLSLTVSRHESLEESC